MTWKAGHHCRKAPERSDPREGGALSCRPSSSGSRPVRNTKALPNDIGDCLNKLLMAHIPGLVSRGHFVGGWPSSLGFWESYPMLKVKIDFISKSFPTDSVLDQSRRTTRKDSHPTSFHPFSIPVHIQQPTRWRHTCTRWSGSHWLSR